MRQIWRASSQAYLISTALVPVAKSHTSRDLLFTSGDNHAKGDVGSAGAMDKTTVTIPLPPNYVPRQGPRQAIYEKVAKGAVSHNGSSGSHGCWVVITGPAGCGKSVILGELLKEVRATRLFEDVVTVRFHEDSKIDQGLHDMVTRMQHQNGAVGKSDRRLLVLDNFDQMNSAIRREANKLDQYFKV